jgi:hypothetical protein
MEQASAHQTQAATAHPKGDVPEKAWTDTGDGVSGKAQQLAKLSNNKFEQRPELLLAAAFCGGVLLARILKRLSNG